MCECVVYIYMDISKTYLHAISSESTLNTKYRWDLGFTPYFVSVSVGFVWVVASSCASHYSRSGSVRWTRVVWAWPWACIRLWRQWPNSQSPRVFARSTDRRWSVGPDTFCASPCCATPWPVAHCVPDGFRHCCQSMSRWPSQLRLLRSTWMWLERLEGLLPVGRRAPSWVAVCASKFLVWSMFGVWFFFWAGQKELW